MFIIGKNLNSKLLTVNSSHSLEGSNAEGLLLIAPESCEVFQKKFFHRKESLSCFKYRRRKVGHSGKNNQSQDIHFSSHFLLKRLNSALITSAAPSTLS